MANPVVAMRSSPLRKGGIRRSALFTGFSSSTWYLCFVALSDLLSTQPGRQFHNFAKITNVGNMGRQRGRFSGNKNISECRFI
jgi:hypothetical protein